MSASSSDPLQHLTSRLHVLAAPIPAVRAAAGLSSEHGRLELACALNELATVCQAAHALLRQLSSAPAGLPTGEPLDAARAAKLLLQLASQHQSMQTITTRMSHVAQLLAGACSCSRQPDSGHAVSTEPPSLGYGCCYYCRVGD